MLPRRVRAMAKDGKNATPSATRLLDESLAIEIDWLPKPGEDNLARLLIELIGEAEIEGLFEDRNCD